MRWTGRILAALGLVALAVDLVRAGAPRPLGAWWHELHSSSLQLTQAGLQRHVAPWLWDPVLLTVLVTPAAWLGLGLGGALLLAARLAR